jgi:histone deacetylase 1/2
VARCWAYETAVALGQHGELRDEIPPNDFLPAYGPNPRLHVDVDPFMENCNSRQYLEQTTNTILENLSRLKGAPSVQFQEVPPDFLPSDAQRQEPSGMAGFLNPSEGALNDE